jgi:hypothetical protein
MYILDVCNVPNKENFSKTLMKQPWFSKLKESTLSSDPWGWLVGMNQRTHQCTIHWMFDMTELWMNLN